MRRFRRSALLALALAAAAGPARGGAGLPDLTATAGDIGLDLDANVELGDVAELCARATNGVDLLRFDATTRNVGSADLVVGDPMCPDCDAEPGAVCDNPDFEYHCSPAGGHGHPHLTDYARYELFDPSDPVDPVRTGGKFGFCLEDTSCTPPAEPFFDCGYQGLTAGCEDLYSRFLGCQYVDVTGLAPGDYVLRVTADPRDVIPEEDETNNSSEYLVSIAGTEEPDVELPGTSLALRAAKGGTRVELLAKSDGAFPLPSPPIAPTVEGATLLVGDDVGAASFDLPAARWKALGRPPGAKGYRYAGGKADPCRKVRLTPSRVRAKCTGSGVGLPAAGAVVIELVSGGARRYCASFGGSERRNDPSRLRRVGAPPAPCPAP
jgi:hypothetical protein